MALYVVEDLGDFWPTDINNDGDMVGTVGPYYDPAPALWRATDPSPTLLPTTGVPAPGELTEGFLNDAGEVIFTGPTYKDARPMPVRWKTTEPGQISDPEVFPADGWTRADICDLNNKGQAVGQGDPQQRRRLPTDPVGSRLTGRSSSVGPVTSGLSMFVLGSVVRSGGSGTDGLRRPSRALPPCRPCRPVADSASPARATSSDTATPSSSANRVIWSATGRGCSGRGRGGPR